MPTMKYLYFSVKTNKNSSFRPFRSNSKKLLSDFLTETWYQTNLGSLLKNKLRSHTQTHTHSNQNGRMKSNALKRLVKYAVWTDKYFAQILRTVFCEQQRGWNKKVMGSWTFSSHFVSNGKFHLRCKSGNFNLQKIEQIPMFQKSGHTGYKTLLHVSSWQVTICNL